MDLFSKHTMVFGLKGAGKSNFTQWIIDDHRAYENTLVYDMCREHGNTDIARYIPSHRSDKKAKAECAAVVEQYVTQNHRDARPDLLVIEEISRVAPNKGGTPDALLDLVDMNRHYAVGILGVARRPAQVDTNLVELADNIIVFSVRGTNDVKRLNQEAPGAGDMAADMKPYEFLRITPDRRFVKHNPVPEKDTTGKL